MNVSRWTFSALLLLAGWAATARAADEPLQKNRLVWFSASQGVTQDNAGHVSAWQNQGSLKLLAMSQPERDHQPQCVKDGIHGQPVLRFDGAKTWLGSGLLPVAISGVLTGRVAVFVVHHPTDPQLFTAHEGRSNRLVSGAPEHYGDYARGLSVPIGGDSSKPLGTVQLQVLTTDIREPLRVLGVGAMMNAELMKGTAFWYAGDIAEILIYAGSLSERDREAVTRYLETKYGL